MSRYDEDATNWWEDPRGSRVEVECEYCGEDGLHWEETENGWRLFNRFDEKHSCIQRETKNDFI